ncbi:hypothetical protein GCM10027418_12080 [Mariniluteicoccus endophyticus]
MPTSSANALRRVNRSDGRNNVDRTAVHSGVDALPMPDRPEGTRWPASANREYGMEHRIAAVTNMCA